MRRMLSSLQVGTIGTVPAQCRYQYPVAVLDSWEEVWKHETRSAKPAMAPIHNKEM